MKNTEYVNAQFEDAEFKIQELFDTISEQAVSARDIAVLDVDINYSWIVSDVIFFCIYKYKNGIRMICCASMQARGTGHGKGKNITGIKKWGMPRQNYTVDHGDGQRMTIEITGEDSVIVWVYQGSKTSVEPFIIDVTY